MLAQDLLCAGDVLGTFQLQGLYHYDGLPSKATQAHGAFSSGSARSTMTACKARDWAGKGQTVPLSQVQEAREKLPGDSSA